MLPAAVIWDMDGVLADTEPLHAETYVRIFGDMGLDLTIEQYRRMVTMGEMSVKDVYLKIGGDPGLWDEAMEKKGALIKDLLERSGEMRPGVLSLLKSLKKNKVPTALATSAGKRSVGIILDRFDLWGYFDEIVVWQDVQASKPAPDAYIIAARKLGVKPKDCVALEDSPRGVLAAIRAGMKCIAIPTPSTDDGDFSQATLVVKSLEDVNIETLSELSVISYQSTGSCVDS